MTSAGNKPNIETVVVTEYTTVPAPTGLPSQADIKDGVVVVTITDYTTIPPLTGFRTVSKTALSVSRSEIQSNSLSEFASSILHASQSMAGASSMSPKVTEASAFKTSSSITGIPPLPTAFATPVKEKTDLQPYNTTTTIIALVSIVLITVLYVLIIGFLCYKTWRGGCEKCKEYLSRIRRLEDGTEPKITPAMVQKRGTVERKMAARPSSSDRQKKANRDIALSALEGRPRAERTSMTNWTAALPESMRTVFSGYATEDKAKGKERAVEPGIELPQVPPAARVTSSVYSRPVGSSTPLPNVFRPSQPINISNPSVVKPRVFREVPASPPFPDPPAQNYADYFTGTNPYVGYGENGHRGFDFGEFPTQERRVNNRRSRAYGGLPDPAEFEDVTTGLLPDTNPRHADEELAQPKKGWGFFDKFKKRDDPPNLVLIHGPRMVTPGPR